MKNQTTADDNREVDLLKQAVRLFLDLYEGVALPGEAKWDAMTLGRAALGEGQPDIEQCAINIANAARSGGINSSHETAFHTVTLEPINDCPFKSFRLNHRQLRQVIWDTLMRDPLTEEVQEIAKVFNNLFPELSVSLLTHDREADNI